MKDEIALGLNRTGMAIHPLESKRMLENVEPVGAAPTAEETVSALSQMRVEESQEAPPLGSMPPPPTLKGMAKALATALTGHRPALLLDKLGERLGFERTGSRLYEAILAKFDATGSWEGGPQRADLEEIHTDELRHLALIHRAIEQLGADPTVVGPSADVVGTMSSGLLQVASDPRSSFRQVLLAALNAELVDNESWQMLIELAEDMGQAGLAEEFRTAKAAEDRHLASVRGWMAEAVLREGRGEAIQEGEGAAPTST